LLFTFNTEQTEFLTQQKKYERVRKAFDEKEQLVIANLKENQLLTSDFNLLIVAFKEEKVLELYGKKTSERNYRLLATYPVCALSGGLGPKRMQGDNQVPEGFYYIDRFNPASNFYLSLGLNYPNKADKAKIKTENTGGDIFIHGSCVTIGCLPMTDDKIKEIYVYAVHAKNNGQEKIPVYIFPFRMTDDSFNRNRERYEHKHDVIEFWTNLRQGYKLFSDTKNELNFDISRTGDYVFLR
jgi:murein L,D-transpeptidase YafK